MRLVLLTPQVSLAVALRGLGEHVELIKAVDDAERRSVPLAPICIPQTTFVFVLSYSPYFPCLFSSNFWLPTAPTFSCSFLTSHPCPSSVPSVRSPSSHHAAPPIFSLSDLSQPICPLLPCNSFLRCPHCAGHRAVGGSLTLQSPCFGPGISGRSTMLLSPGTQADAQPPSW